VELFVYGTLTDPERASEVLGESPEFGPDAVLEGLGRVEGEYPTLAPGGETPGRILETDDVDALDRYEGVDRGLYVRVTVPRADGDGSVDTYVGNPDRLDAPATWPGTGAFEGRVEQYVADNGVAVTRR
jgi:gamma-glutamylcyclotransferase (GGCT)/AIG2-like uncharacterized protein YtfP